MQRKCSKNSQEKDGFLPGLVGGAGDTEGVALEPPWEACAHPVTRRAGGRGGCATGHTPWPPLLFPGSTLRGKWQKFAEELQGTGTRKPFPSSILGDCPLSPDACICGFLHCRGCRNPARPQPSPPVGGQGPRNSPWGQTGRRSQVTPSPLLGRLLSRSPWPTGHPKGLRNSHFPVNTLLPCLSEQEERGPEGWKKTPNLPSPK